MYHDPRACGGTQNRKRGDNRMKKYKRIFTIVIDSLGAGALPDAADYGDAGTDTLGHISQSVDTFNNYNGIFL